MQPGISFSELLAWIAEETDRYERWFATQPAAAWSVPVGSGRIATIRDLLHHIYIADLRLAQRVHGLLVSVAPPDPPSDPMALFQLARQGQGLLTDALDGSVDLDQVISWQAQSGVTLRASGRKVMAHALTHHIRHLAQAATLLRLHGFPTDWTHDLLLSEAMA